MPYIESVPNNESPQPEPPLSRKILRDGVYDAVLEMLLGNTLTPGSSLRIDALARQLGVSPTPVREALAELEHTGLVTRAALRGYTVAQPLSAHQISELFSARRAIELASLESALPAAPSDIENLRRHHERHVSASDAARAAVEQGDPEAGFATFRDYFDADWGFHVALLEMSGNSYLLQMAKSLSPHLHRMRQSAGTGPTDVHLAIAEHAAILEAVAAGDVTVAVAAMSSHLASVNSRAVHDAAHPLSSRSA